MGSAKIVGILYVIEAGSILLDSQSRAHSYLPSPITASQLQFATDQEELSMIIGKKILVSAFAAATFATVNVSPALAQGPIDSRTEFTFNNPVELPGVTLPPGTYVFRFADSTTSKSVMQVLAKNNSNKTYGLFLTIPAQRPKASNDAELRFLETPAGKPAAVKTWWYPGNSTGREFIYPKAQGRRLAMATNTSVLTAKTETVPTSTPAASELAYVSPSGQESPVTDQMLSEVASAAPTGSNMTSDRVPIQEGTSASNMPRRSLPRTNTMLPLIGLMGMASLAGATSLRFRRR
jgi:hypothetical protein